MTDTRIPDVADDPPAVLHTDLVRDGDATVKGSAVGAGVTIIAIQGQGAGYGPALHLHPYREVFLIHAGAAEFRVGSRTLVAGAGDVLVVPPRVPHKFTVVGDTPYTATDIHESPEPITVWLEEGGE